jgi:serine/threonine protein kinase/WD40 repeat protein
MATPRANADRNLLFGILAVQMDFISRDALIVAMNTWVLDKAKPLGQILVEQAALTSRARDKLNEVVELHLEIHGGDPQKSLAAVSSIGSVRQELHKVVDAELQASLAQVSATRPKEEDPWAAWGPAEGQTSVPGIRFRILHKHAEGGLGAVFVAHDEELHRQVALKEIKEKYADHAESRARFLREAEVTGRLEHPGIVPVYGLGCYPDGRPFYAMRFIKGDSLRDTIQRFYTAEETNRDPGERSLAFRELLGRFVDACNALAYAHARGILHRDVKPHNIMLGKYGETLVVDWGLAKVIGSREGLVGSDEGTLQPASGEGTTPTQVGDVLGTPAYMSPEQAGGHLERLGPASDIYSLGATLYELLTGTEPVQGNDVVKILAKVKGGDWLPPRKVRKHVPPALDAICCMAMALRPEERYASVFDLAADIEHWLADEPVSAWSEPWTSRARRWLGRHRRLLTPTAATVLVATAGSIVGIIHERQEARRQGFIPQVQRIRFTTHSHGWFERAWHLVRQAARIRGDQQLRDQAAALLHGLDATSRPGLKGDASSVVFSRDGTRLLIGCSADNRGKPNGPARLWKLGIEEPNASDLPGEGPVAFDPDGAALQCVPDPENRYTLKLWNVEKRVLVRELKLAENTARQQLTGDNRPTLALAVDGSLVGASTTLPDGKPTFIVWEAASGKQVKRLDKHATAIAFSPDGRLLAAGDATGTIALWNLKQAGEPLTLQRTRTAIHCLAFTRDRRWFVGKNAPEETWLLAAGDGGSDVTIWDLQARQALSICRGFSKNEVFAVAFSPDGTLLVSAGREYPILWEVATGKSLLQLQERNWMTGAAFSPDGKKLAVTSTTAFGMPGGVDVSQLADGRGMRTLRGQASRIERIVLSPDSRFLAAIGVDWRVGIWEFASGRLLHILEVPEGFFLSITSRWRLARMVIDLRSRPGRRLSFGS